MKSRSLRFSLRFLMLVTAAFAIAGGWLNWRIQKGIRQHEATLEIVKTNSIVLFDHYFDSQGAFISGPTPAPPQPEWLRELFGEHAFTTIRQLELSHHFNDDDAVHLQHLFTLRNIDLSGRDISDRTLEHLSGLSQLQTLSLSSTNISDEGMQAIGSMTQLRHLNLMHNRISDAGMRHLRNLQQLESLSVYFTSVSDGGLEAISQLTNLKSLDIGRTGISDRGMEHLRNLTNLETLNLQQTGITAEGLRQLSNLRKLKRLRVDGCEIPYRDKFLVLSTEQQRGQQETLKLLGHLRQDQLNLASEKITDADLIALTGTPEIRDVHFSGEQLTDAGLRALKRFPKLRRVGLSSPNITDAGIDALLELRLEHLALWNTSITDAGVRRLRQQMPDCEILLMLRNGSAR